MNLGSYEDDVDEDDDEDDDEDEEDDEDEDDEDDDEDEDEDEDEGRGGSFCSLWNLRHVSGTRGPLSMASTASDQLYTLP
jgi:hypothetical protein